MDAKILSDYILPILTLCGVVFEAGRTRAKIDSEIAASKSFAAELVDKANDATREEINRLRNSLDIHLATYENKQEMIEYRLGGLNEKIEHKFQRLHANQKDIQGFLQKGSGFVPREN